MSRPPRPLPDTATSPGGWRTDARLDRLTALCGRYGYEVRVVRRGRRGGLLVDLTAYGVRVRRNLWDAEQVVAVWIAEDLAEFERNRVLAGYPAVPLVAAGSAS